MPAVVLPRADLPFPGSLPEFQRLFPDDTACAAYLEAIRWRDGFVCGWGGEASEPYRFANRAQVLRCRKCQRDNALTAGTVMERTRTPLSIWFWAAYLVSSHTPGISAVQFQRQLGLNRYETAFQILHKLRAGMVRPARDRIGGQSRDLVEIHQRKPENVKGVPRRNGRYAGRIRMEVVADRSARSLCGFVEAAVEPGAVGVTGARGGHAAFRGRGYRHLPVAAQGDPSVAEDFLPISHLIFSNLKSWLRGCHHGVSPQHLQAYLNEFTFRFNRRFYPFNAFRSLLGIS